MNFVEQSSPWEDDGLTADQQVYRFLENNKSHYYVHKIPLSVSISSHLSPIRSLPLYFLKIRCNIAHSSGTSNKIS